MRLMQRLEILVGKREDIQGAYNALTSLLESSWCIYMPFFGVKMKLDPSVKDRVYVIRSLRAGYLR